MLPSEKAAEKWIPKERAQREAVLEQLERIVKSPLFSQSRRYPAFLKYVVEQTLAGHTEHLKERTLGIEVFGRPAEYDSNADPVVRVTAGEIRKRIAQYYFDFSHEDELRIEIPLGSYVPEFSLPKRRPTPPVAVVPVETRLEVAPPHAAPERPRSRLLWLAIAFACCLIAAVFWFRPVAQPSALDQFWEGTISAPGPALLIVSVQSDLPGLGAPGSQTVSADTPLPQYKLDRWMNRVGLADATTLAQIAGVFYAKNKDYRVAGDQSIRLNDMRHGPVALIGAFNNEWTMRLTRGLRFGFTRDTVTAGQHRITDSQKPDRRDLEGNSEVPYQSISEDYAIIARYRDQVCGCPVIIAGGLGEYGTLAAGEFLSNNNYLREILPYAPKNWQKMNMEAVIATRVVNGNSGPPRLIDAYFW